MKNVLHWLPPEGIVEDKLIYNVKYLIYGTDKWIKNPECKNIHRTWCDLSYETRDHKELYHARVKAFLDGNCSSWAESPRFNPFTDTKIDPPAFAMASTETSVSVIVAPPVKWKRDPKEQPKYLHQIYTGLQYNVSLFNKNRKKKWIFCIKNNRLDVFQLESNTVYCVMVQVYVTPLLLSGFSKELCIVTLKDPTFRQTTTIIFGYILPALLIIFIILVSSCCVYKYIHITKQRYPKNLIVKYNNCETNTVVPSEKIVVNFITVNIVDECKNSPLKDPCLQSNASSFAWDCDGSNVEEKPSKEYLEDIRSQDEETALKNEQNGNGSRMRRLGSHHIVGQRHNEEVIVYELNVRAEETIPTQEEPKELSLEENICTLEGLWHNSPKTLSDLVTNETEQSSCPQFDVGPSHQNLRTFLWNKVSCTTVDHHIPLINLLTDKLDQTSFSEHGMVTDICLAPDQKEPFWDEETALKEIQTFACAMSGKTTLSDCSEFATCASQDQETAEEAEGDEQSIIVDWDPHTGKLFLPSFLNLTNDAHEEITEMKKYTEFLGEGFLSKLDERQCSDEQLEGEEEAYLLQLKEQWGLNIQMQT
ncbi:interleukin-20 receptor subunit alpha-like isoform X2 [Hemicordylus capensis]|nr:interleukin-20 receptor subunit alpha-like isoform X2 [Hemicordylus capensis]